jgi:thiol-disulfide isomerase/thioredoxin
VSFFSNLRTAGSLPVEGHLPGFERATGWLNSPPLSTADLQGKVVLVDFWTYTCINWLRTLAYLRAWAEKYQDQGLVMVGVHTPEFPFEREVDNVRQAVQDMAIRYPVAIDSEYAIWQAFANRFWPAIYIADAQGRIRHHQFGEGGFAECEMVIQRLLGESGRDTLPHDLVSFASVSRLWPPGRAWRLPRPTSATSKHEGWHLSAIQSSTRPTPTSHLLA